MGEEVEHGWQSVTGRHRHGRGNENNQRLDIATSRNFNKNQIHSLMTYFLTDFSDSYGAKAIFNVFHNYGEVMEVVIPAKRDKGGRRFGFARFDEVVDPRTLEQEMDNIYFGNRKISVNLSRFKRSEGSKKGVDMRRERWGDGDNSKQVLSRSRPTTRTDQPQSHQHQFTTAEYGNYAQAVLKGGTI
ncbi:hypothetical protein TSUD_99990 [Trifolium subterraneum]|uniref:RRM domain-containing protein n=1 Tax=Trifolium subterraneum TaxID=3900 RepID=A0A2Z6PK11_TRISU|nr:hypothetical protein TSUD_99990 [Trifolium subterraneum]